MSRRFILAALLPIIAIGCLINTDGVYQARCVTADDCPKDPFLPDRETYACVEPVPDAGRVCALIYPVPAIPGAKGVRKAGRQDGQRFVAFEIVWTDGVLTHELFVLGRAGDVRQADVPAAAAAVYARTADAPLPGG